MNKVPKGFIIDAPNVLIISGNNTYNCVTATQGQITFQGSSVEIKAGQSLYDLISIPSGMTLTVSMTDARIDGDMLELGMGASRTENQSHEQWKFGNPYIVDETNGTVVFDEAVNPGTLQISQLTETDSETPATGQFHMKVEANKTTVTFADDMKGQEIIPSYSVNVNALVYDAFNDALPRKGKVILQFPVYSGDTQSSGIENICQITIWSASINQNTTIGGSYKTASTFGLEMKGLDGKRPDKKIWSVAFLPYNG